MQMELGPQADIRSPGDRECRDIRMRDLRGPDGSDRLARVLLRRETADMLADGCNYWLCAGSRLERLKDSPPDILFVRGPVDLCSPKIAIVGPRRPDSYALDLARMFATAFAEAGITVVSGGAAGIDTQAHQACLDAGGRTMCVLGGGFDRPFPAMNSDMFAALGRPGPYRDSCLVSEYPPAMRAMAHHFPARNRIVAGLSDAVVVIQADYGSGALITARTAMKNGIPVFAVPADIGWKGSVATNDLLGRGAVALCRPTDISCVAAFKNTRLSGQSWPSPVRRPRGQFFKKAAASGNRRTELSGTASDLLKRIRETGDGSGAGVEIDRLSGDDSRTAARMQAALLELELAGLATRLPGNLVALSGVCPGISDETRVEARPCINNDE